MIVGSYSKSLNCWFLLSDTDRIYGTVGLYGRGCTPRQLTKPTILTTPPQLVLTSSYETSVIPRELRKYLGKAILFLALALSQKRRPAAGGC